MTTGVGMRWLGSLRTRLIAMLSVALLPLGLVAVYQTATIVRDAGTLTARDILSRTEAATATQYRVLLRAFGAAGALGAAAAALDDADNAACDAIMDRFLQLNPEYVFAGFVDRDGRLRCSDVGQDVDLSQSDVWRRFSTATTEAVAVSRSGAVSGQPVLIVSVPIRDAASGALLGRQNLSLPQSLSALLLSERIEALDLALIDASGAVLAASTGLEDTSRFDRIGIVPADLSVPADGLLTTRETAANGTQPVAIMSLVPGQVYAVGIWAEGTQTGASAWDISATAFPILMWLASMAVAYLTIDRLVLRHLTALRRRMADFSFNDPGRGVARLDHAPDEIEAIAQSHNDMITGILSDRENLRDTVREKELLLKEVHHRVKNNLQLISSILNMNIRTAKGQDAKDTLKRVQDRVLSLATIHKALYADTRVDQVRADRIVAEIVGSMFSMGLPTTSKVRTSLEVAPVRLDPDQAVPLCLLATEAVTNALKYVGKPPDGPPAISASLGETPDGSCELTISNTRGAPVPDLHPSTGSGLGSRLILAFGSQLGGKVDVTETDTEYRLVARFVKLGSSPDEGEADAAA